jgi:hypothetical protein
LPPMALKPTTSPWLFIHMLSPNLKADSHQTVTALAGTTVLCLIGSAPSPSLKQMIMNSQGCSLGCSSLPSASVHPGTRVRSELRRERQ